MNGKVEFSLFHLLLFMLDEFLAKIPKFSSKYTQVFLGSNSNHRQKVNGFSILLVFLSFDDRVETRKQLCRLDIEHSLVMEDYSLTAGAIVWLSIRISVVVSP